MHTHKHHRHRNTQTQKHPSTRRTNTQAHMNTQAYTHTQTPKHTRTMTIYFIHTSRKFEDTHIHAQAHPPKHPSTHTHTPTNTQAHGESTYRSVFWLFSAPAVQHPLPLCSDWCILSSSCSPIYVGVLQLKSLHLDPANSMHSCKCLHHFASLSPQLFAVIGGTWGQKKQTSSKKKKKIQGKRMLSRKLKIQFQASAAADGKLQSMPRKSCLKQVFCRFYFIVQSWAPWPVYTQIQTRIHWNLFLVFWEKLVYFQFLATD